MRDHEIMAVTWTHPGEEKDVEGGTVIDGGKVVLSDGTSVSPLVWSPAFVSPLGTPLKAVGLRFVNRTDWYRCRE